MRTNETGGSKREHSGAPCPGQHAAAPTWASAERCLCGFWTWTFRSYETIASAESPDSRLRARVEIYDVGALGGTTLIFLKDQREPKERLIYKLPNVRSEATVAWKDNLTLQIVNAEQSRYAMKQLTAVTLYDGTSVRIVYQ